MTRNSIPAEFKGDPLPPDVEIVKVFESGERHYATCSEPGLGHWRDQGYVLVSELVDD